MFVTLPKREPCSQALRTDAQNRKNPHQVRRWDSPAPSLPYPDHGRRVGDHPSRPHAGPPPALSRVPRTFGCSTPRAGRAPAFRSLRQTPVLWSTHTQERSTKALAPVVDALLTSQREIPPRLGCLARKGLERSAFHHLCFLPVGREGCDKSTLSL